MAIKKGIDNNIVFLVVDKDELKSKIEVRIQLGLNIHERTINTEKENDAMWTEFIDWNNFNEELIRQAFDKPKNIHIEEYEYKPGISFDYFSGKENSFQDDVEVNKSAIKYQVRKLRWFYEKLELLKVKEQTEKANSITKQFNYLIHLLNRFHKVAQTIRERHNNNETIVIRNEYDVQDLLNGLLHINFDDIRKEDFSPSHAGGNSRLDFVLKKEKIIIEVKMTSENLSVNKLGQDLLVDIGRYKEYPDSTDLVIFIYDKGDHIRNKTGLICDLQKQSTSKLRVTVIINPI